ncbi:hypothetical protein HDK90DRAFT_470977 [Phyllosticta capitalensis]|uniref:Uncharacterized protein n=1 Tax=Phyllosticta capitalensis TaxID=121624 RepID=A0ABR1Y983_9PEZI
MTPGHIQEYANRIGRTARIGHKCGAAGFLPSTNLLDPSAILNVLSTPATCLPRPTIASRSMFTTLDAPLASATFGGAIPSAAVDVQNHHHPVSPFPIRAPKASIEKFERRKCQLKGHFSKDSPRPISLPRHIMAARRAFRHRLKRHGRNTDDCPGPHYRRFPDTPKAYYDLKDMVVGISACNFCRWKQSSGFKKAIKERGTISTPLSR